MSSSAPRAAAAHSFPDSTVSILLCFSDRTAHQDPGRCSELGSCCTAQPDPCRTQAVAAAQCAHTSRLRRRLCCQLNLHLLSGEQSPQEAKQASPLQTLWLGGSLRALAFPLLRSRVAVSSRGLLQEPSSGSARPECKRPHGQLHRREETKGLAGGAVRTGLTLTPGQAFLASSQRTEYQE